MPKKRSSPRASKAAKRAMPKFTPAPPEVVDAFDRAFATVAGLERRKMFGYPAAFSRGLMVACVFQDRIMVRLDEHDWHEAMQLPGGKIFEVMPGRPMKEYVQLPPPVLADPAALGAWVERVVAYAATLPRKDRPRLA